MNGRNRSCATRTLPCTRQRGGAVHATRSSTPRCTPTSSTVCSWRPTCGGRWTTTELVLYYQPIIDLKTQQLTGFEALVRWNHPTRGLIYPMEFIPLAEENGLIAHIGEWILHEACRELKVLQQRFPAEPPLKMSINISGKQFTQQDLVEKLCGPLQGDRGRSARIWRWRSRRA